VIEAALCMSLSGPAADNAHLPQPDAEAQNQFSGKRGIMAYPIQEFLRRRDFDGPICNGADRSTPGKPFNNAHLAQPLAFQHMAQREGGSTAFSNDFKFTATDS
jgi:hypothetical protein